MAANNHEPPRAATNPFPPGFSSHVIAEVLAVAPQRDVQHQDGHAGEGEAHDGAGAEGHVERRRPACALGPDRRAHVRVHGHLHSELGGSQRRKRQGGGCWGSEAGLLSFFVIQYIWETTPPQLLLFSAFRGMHKLRSAEESARRPKPSCVAPHDANGRSGKAHASVHKIDRVGARGNTHRSTYNVIPAVDVQIQQHTTVAAAAAARYTSCHEWSVQYSQQYNSVSNISLLNPEGLHSCAHNSSGTPHVHGAPTQSACV